MVLLCQTCKREHCDVVFLPKRLRHPANIANDDKCAATEIAIVLIPRLFPLTPTGQCAHRQDCGRVVGHPSIGPETPLLTVQCPGCR